MVTNTLSRVLVSIVSPIWLTRKETRPSSRSTNGSFHPSPGGALRTYWPNRVMIPASAVFTVKKHPAKALRPKNTTMMTNSVTMNSMMD